MGNYKDLEKEFIERTLLLIDQYYQIVEGFPFEEQFNYTLTINCMLGLIVLPKERVVRYIPNERLLNEYKQKIGLQETILGDGVVTLKDLVEKLRHAVAHFNIKVISENEKGLIDWVEFIDEQNGGKLVAKFRATEILPFLRCYSECLLLNLNKYKK